MLFLSYLRLWNEIHTYRTAQSLDLWGISKKAFPHLHLEDIPGTSYAEVGGVLASREGNSRSSMSRLQEEQGFPLSLVFREL